MRVNGAKLESVTASEIDQLLERLNVKGGTPKENKKAIQNMRANAKLPSSAGTWEEIDEQVMEAYQQEAYVTEDVRAANTTNHDLGNLYSSYRRMSQMTDAEIDQHGEVAGDEDRTDYELATIPVPVIHKEFRVGWRESENTDTTADNVDEATRAVTRALEDLIWGNVSFSIGGNSIVGLQDTPTSGNWGGSGDWATASNAYSEVINAMQTLMDNGFGAPYVLYVDNAYRDDLMGLRSNTTMNYVDIIEDLDEIDAVRFDSRCPSDEAYLVSMSRRSIDWTISQWITPVSWDIGPNGRATQHQVFAVAAPRVKKDLAGNAGVNRNTDISS